MTLQASGTPSGGSYRWYTVPTGGTAIAGATGASYTTPSLAVGTTKYYVSAYTPQGCESARTEVNAVVNPAASVVITNPAAVCSPATVNLTAASIKNGSSAGLTYTYWTNAGATTALSNPSAVSVTGTYYIKGTNASGCFDIKPVAVTVNSAASVVITNPAAVCSPATVNLTAASIKNGSSAGLTYTYWTNAGATTALSNPSAVSVTGTYYIKGTNASGCFDIKPVAVTVNSAASVVITNPAAVCSPATVNLTAASVTSGSSAGHTYTYWTDAGATTALSNPSAVAATGTYYIKGTNASGCFDIKAVAVTVNTPVDVNGSISSDGTPEVGKQVTFTVSTNIAPADLDIASIRWSVNGTVVQSGVTSYTMTPANNDPFDVECVVPSKSGTCYTGSPKTLKISSITPLPVEIIYFNAARQGNNVLLEWATASEQNNAGFEVQTSQDGFTFRKMGFVATLNGNTSVKQTYTYTDTENGKYGTRYYRLKQLDTDGTFEYFTAKAVSFVAVNGYSLKASPNPFESEVSLEVNADQAGKLNVQVLDAMGKAVLAEQFAVSKGLSTEKLTLWQSLPKGIYFVRTEMNGIAHNFKLLKK